MKNDTNDTNDARYDFGGDDADVVPLGDPQFDEWISKMAPTLNAPDVTPRIDMWRAIEAAGKSDRDAARDDVPGVLPLRRRPWRLMSMIAAALLLGVALDRLALRREGSGSGVTGPGIAAGTTGTDSSDPTRLYRMAAAQTLTQAEALLTAYRASEPGRNPVAARELGRWGRDILSSTRLLIDSPAGSDARLRSLLDDLELVLVQIIDLSGGPLEASERALIDRALEDRDLLPRIRTAVPAAPAMSGSAD
jgi:hypothetical protein